MRENNSSRGSNSFFDG